MSYLVIIDPRACEQLDEAYEWWADNRSAEQAARWYNGISVRLSDLAENPEQFPLAAEDYAFPFEVRELHYGLGSKPTHRALFTIRPGEVYVFCIRHVAQRPLTPEDL